MSSYMWIPQCRQSKYISNMIWSPIIYGFLTINMMNWYEQRHKALLFPLYSIMIGQVDIMYDKWAWLIINEEIFLFEHVSNTLVGHLSIRALRA
jgi:hypothetical protein